MKIRRLELIGFKSFMNKTVLTFEDGITSVVGPNGCGKSNVVDAIFWVMGDQSAKHLRGREMEDIIFAGTSTQSSAGLAEVNITFSMEDGGAPAEFSQFSEVTVSRRLYRSGESEYLINQTPCRLKDVVEFFMDTGVGSKSYSIIEQGQIGKIISQKPEERRSLIEEAAGILKYKSRKREAQLKMEGTEQNLLRINDIISEIKRQMDSLERQAKKAEKYKLIKEQIREIELTMMSQDYKLSLDLLAEKQKILEQEEREQAELQAEIQKAEALIEQLKLAIVDQEKGLAAAQEQYYKHEQRIQELENERELKKKEIERWESLKEKDEQSLAQLKEKNILLQKSLKNCEEVLRVLSQEESGLNESLGQKEATLQSETEKYKILVQKIESEKSELLTMLTSQTRSEQYLLNLEQQKKQIDQKMDQLISEEEDLREELQEVHEEKEGVETALKNVAIQKEEILSQKEVTEKKIDELKTQVSNVTIERDRLREEFQKLDFKIQSLEEIERSRGSGALNEIRSQVLGALSDLLETDPESEKAVEAVLGDKLRLMIVQERSRALELISYLRSEQKGIAQVTWIKEKMDPWIVPPHLSHIEPLWKKVKTDSAYEALIYYLLRDVYLVQDLEMAIKLWDQVSYQFTFVTPAGEMLSSEGIILTGNLIQNGILSRKREIKEYISQKEICEKKCGELDQKFKELNQGILECEGEVDALVKMLHEQEVSQTGFTKDVSSAEVDIDRLEEEGGVVLLEREELSHQRRELEATMAIETHERSVWEEKSKAKSSSLETAKFTEQRVLESLERARKEVHELNIQSAQCKEKKDALIQQKSHLDQSRQELDSEMLLKKQSIEECAQNKDRIERAIESGISDIKSAFLGLEGFKQNLSNLKGSFDAAQEELRRLEDSTRKKRSVFQSKESRCHEIRLQISQHEMNLKHIKEQIYERYLLDLHGIYERYLAKTISDVERQNLLGLKEKAARMGEVNLTSIEEFQELNTRYQSLETQRQDLLQSLESLKKTIEKINRVTRERFHETFAIVNRNFKKVFPILFSGGQAELILTNENNLLDTGVDILAKPPGKKLQNMNLLSGGEKALTAISLIFGIFLMKPSPFCLLDEVDAPLDDANVSRFNEMVRQMTSHSQFIVITHNKKTMEKADVLYGVTMEQPGVSTLISVKLDQAIQMTKSSRSALRPPEAQA